MVQRGRVMNDIAKCVILGFLIIAGVIAAGVGFAYLLINTLLGGN